MALTIEQFTCRSDNFGILIHDTEANVTASIDAPEFQPIVDQLAARGWDLDEILTTHHHARPCRSQSDAEDRLWLHDHRTRRRGRQDPRHRQDGEGRATPSPSAASRCG